MILQDKGFRPSVACHQESKISKPYEAGQVSQLWKFRFGGKKLDMKELSGPLQSFDKFPDKVKVRVLGALLTVRDLPIWEACGIVVRNAHNIRSGPKVLVQLNLISMVTAGL